MVDDSESTAAQSLMNLKRSEGELLDTFQHHLANRPFGYQDLYLMGIARRALAQAKAFRSCIEDLNWLVAAALLRLQLDTVLRLYALYWVSDPEEFAGRVFAGEQVNRLKAADGQQMSDRYLIDKVKDRNAWVDAVYKNTSGVIHFSNRHMHAAIRLTNEETGDVEGFIGATDPKQEIEDFAETIEAFFHCTAIIGVATADLFKRFNAIHRRIRPSPAAASTHTAGAG
ncbi:hypothetical protein [Novosphingobium sp. PC22D]|uniref:hypothetical protein n=1 Tax=Novosphingobium sp. PC22D TaxID=1962403 RepID=UPI0011459CC2|nr:hypothetical protein [Novosphingobium sp. PC22D]